MHVNDCPAPAHHLHHSTFLIQVDLIEQRSNTEVSSNTESTHLISTSSTLSVFPSSSHSQLLTPFKYNYHLRTIVLLQPIDVNLTIVLIRKPATEWQVHGVYTAHYNTRIS
ncbi:hypothetical protein O0I10_011348 [Lichtheimia ornata]|uniref:Uncharacterized protein n=1 Tax=Lichtheimia ornata TaxID=688661 RepID=A0AAD7UUN9_9FUNG|nr:uncharacterized protein O0I10_011348 [Lichtheimia ornata]KAJ8652967.1 hypothetical protein O0I10_011348 [Lichtheimia ornata]